MIPGLSVAGTEGGRRASGWPPMAALPGPGREEQVPQDGVGCRRGTSWPRPWPGDPCPSPGLRAAAPEPAVAPARADEGREPFELEAGCWRAGRRARGKGLDVRWRLDTYLKGAQVFTSCRQAACTVSYSALDPALDTGTLHVGPASSRLLTVERRECRRSGNTTWRAIPLPRIPGQVVLPKLALAPPGEAHLCSLTRPFLAQEPRARHRLSVGNGDSWVQGRQRKRGHKNRRGPVEDGRPVPILVLPSFSSPGRESKSLCSKGSPSPPSLLRCPPCRCRCRRRRCRRGAIHRCEYPRRYWLLVFARTPSSVLSATLPARDPSAP